MPLVPCHVDAVSRLFQQWAATGCSLARSTMRNKVPSSLSAYDSNNDKSTTVERGPLNTSSQVFFCNATN